ncbi:phage minor head protein [Selenomonas noxia]|uniref:phage minor head protein n=1 Tax=Selenomonas noxia TaxID=135083 RepID=UPI0032C14B13
MNQPLWMPKRRIEVAFRRALLDISKGIVMRVGETSDPAIITATLEHLSRSPDFIQLAESIAMKMVTGLFDDTGRTWREAARNNGRGREIYRALQKELQGARGERIRALVKENADLISTLPKNIADDVTAYVARETMKGRRASDIAEEIRRRFPKDTKARAQLIARTQVSMTQTNLVQARAEDLGLDWYVWRACGGNQGDGRTRSSHKHMSGVLVRWSDPPAPEDLFPLHHVDGTPYKNTLGHYHAGCCPNCRCYPEPVVDLDLLNFPMRVYRNGHIERISRKQFERR